MKLIDKSAVVAEIERQISNGQTKLKESEECKDYESYVAWAERIATYINVLSFLDTLEVQEVPVDDDLEEAAIEYCGGNKGSDARVRTGFIMGAKWQKQQMMAKAIDAKVEADLDSHGADYGIQRLECEYGQLEALKIKNESKVKVIVTMK